MKPFELGKLENTGLDWEGQEMDDGEVWFRTIISNMPEDSLVPNGSLVVVTAEGKRLLDKNPSLLTKFLLFKKASNEGAGRKKKHVRSHIKSGGNSDVYALGKTGIAVKEALTTQSIHSAAERMDRLYRLIENAKKMKTFPKWIGLPKHYGYLVPPIDAKNNRQYLMMEQIDSGVTVEDIISMAERGIEDRALVEERLGYNLTDADVEEIKESWSQMKGFLETAIANNNALQDNDNKKTFREWAPDFHEGSVLTERVDPPLDGKHFKLWIIDQ